MRVDIGETKPRMEVNTRMQVAGDDKEVNHSWACVGELQFISLAKEDMHQTWIIPGDKVILYTDHVCFSAIFFLMNKAKLCGAYYQMKSCGYLHFCAVVACCVGALFLGLQMYLQRLLRHWYHMAAVMKLAPFSKIQQATTWCCAKVFNKEV